MRTIPELKAECKRLASDFVIDEVPSQYGPVLSARCTLRGKRVELAEHFDKGEGFTSRAVVERRILETCVRDLGGS